MMETHPLAEYALSQARKMALEEVRLFAQKIIQLDAIRGNQAAITAITDEYDMVKDMLLPTRRAR